jgi:hypothetical protein
METLGLVLLMLAGAFAAAEELECYQKEIDPSTHRIYQNKAQWEADRKDLWAKAPAMPNLFRLRKGYYVGVEESKNAARMRPDKRQHCYVGCRIANEAGHDVASYAAYYKEDKDILDCNRHSFFDLTDIEATIAGADLAMENPEKADAEYCDLKCGEKYPRRRR